jgi:hypothetical protein
LVAGSPGIVALGLAVGEQVEGNGERQGKSVTKIR